MVGMRNRTTLATLLTLTALLLGAGTARPASARDGDGTKPKAGAGEQQTPQGDARKGDAEALFKRIDANGDGKVTVEELKAKAAGRIEPAKLEKVFKKADANGDAGVTLEEVKSASEAVRDRLQKLAQKVKARGNDKGKAKAKGSKAKDA